MGWKPRVYGRLLRALGLLGGDAGGDGWRRGIWHSTLALEIGLFVIEHQFCSEYASVVYQKDLIMRLFSCQLFAALHFPFVSGTIQPKPNGWPIWLLVTLLSLNSPCVNADEGNLTLTISCSANGDVSPKGGLVLPKMSDITLTATPNTGYKIDDWYFNGVNAGSDAKSLYLPLGDIDVSVYVQFIRITNLVHAWAGSSGSLSPNSDPGPLGVAWGDSLNFTAQPDPHYHVDEWKVDDVLARKGGTTFTLQNVTAEHWVDVTFAPDVYTVQATAGRHGSLSPTARSA
jgi:hypothetical protein